MASGMEVSTRMISLAINIAVMEFILVKGILANLSEVLPQKVLAFGLVDLVAAGNFVAAEAEGISTYVARNALIHGFGWVMLYGAMAPMILGIIAVFVFGKKK